MEPAVNPNKGLIFNTFASDTPTMFWMTEMIAQNIKYNSKTLPPNLNNFNDAPRPIVVKNANMKKSWMNEASNLILTMPNESKVATKIAKIKPPITGAGIQMRFKKLTWLTIALPSK